MEKKQGTVTPDHQPCNLHGQRLHRSLTSSWSNQHFGRRLANGGAPRLDPGTGALRTLALSRRASKTTLMRARTVCMDSTVQRRVVRGCALAHVHTVSTAATSWRWALYNVRVMLHGVLNLVQVVPPLTLLAADPGTRATPGRFHRFTLAGCPRPVTMLQCN